MLARLRIASEKLSVVVEGRKQAVLKFIEALVSIIVKDGDGIARFVTKVGAWALVGIWLIYLVAYPVKTSVQHSEALLTSHVQDMQNVSQALQQLNNEMRRHSNQLAQTCANDAGGNEEKRARCFDALNGYSPR